MLGITVELKEELGQLIFKKYTNTFIKKKKISMSA